LYPPLSVANIFEKGADHRFKLLIMVETLAIIWSIWLHINDKKYNNKNSSLVQVMCWCIALFCS
jgi:hypothetical protein